MKKIAISGAGGMGCALAAHLSSLGHVVSIYSPFKDEVDEISQNRENRSKLPGVLIPDSVKVTNDSVEAFSDAEVIALAAPSQQLRSAVKTVFASAPGDALYVCCAKGIENGTKMLMSSVIHEVAGDIRLAVLSGPSHAEELARKMPTVMVAAADNRQDAETVRALFSSESLRIYTGDDVAGVELGGALKNVIALCAGIVEGYGYGDNTKAALMTRGMAEIARLGVSMGARRETFFGLAGMGDLIVTCTSMHSRNRRAGMLIGRGMSVKDALTSVNMTVEGYETCRPAYELSLEYGVQMPITASLYQILKGSLSVKDAVEMLMKRENKDEFI